MTFEIVFVTYVTVFVLFFIYYYTSIQLIDLLIKTKSITSKYSSEVKKLQADYNRNVKLATIWPILVLLLTYEKFKK